MSRRRVARIVRAWIELPAAMSEGAGPRDSEAMSAPRGPHLLSCSSCSSWFATTSSAPADRRVPAAAPPISTAARSLPTAMPGSSTATRFSSTAKTRFSTATSRSRPRKNNFPPFSNSWRPRKHRLPPRNPIYPPRNRSFPPRLPEFPPFPRHSPPRSPNLPPRRPVFAKNSGNRSQQAENTSQLNSRAFHPDSYNRPFV